MHTRIVGTALCVALLATSGSAFADCAADATVADAQWFYADAQKQERAGNNAGAFRAYVAAQEYTCDPNPVAASAAQRGAVLGLALGAAAEKNGAFDKAFAIYEDAGQYAAADRALMSLVRSKPDDPSVFEKAHRVFEDRASPAFLANNQIRLRVTGNYAANPQNLAAVMQMPATGFQRALTKETTALSEQYLSDYVQLILARPDDPTNTAAMQALMSTQQQFAQKWPGEPVKGARDALDLARSWAAVTPDAGLRDKLEAQRRQHIEKRVNLLTKTYSGAPALLDVASDYLQSANLEDADRRARVAAVRNQAGRLGDEALAKQRFTLAADYYDVAALDDKASAVRERQQQLAMSRMQPSIDQMKQQAEALRATYGDPAKVQAMREQALAMKKSLQQQQAGQQANAKKADALEKELGM